MSLVKWKDIIIFYKLNKFGCSSPLTFLSVFESSGWNRHRRDVVADSDRSDRGSRARDLFSGEHVLLFPKVHVIEQGWAGDDGRVMHQSAVHRSRPTDQTLCLDIDIRYGADFGGKILSADNYMPSPFNHTSHAHMTVMILCVYPIVL